MFSHSRGSRLRKAGKISQHASVEYAGKGERLRAIDAAHPKVREVHLELAERYEQKLGEFVTREQERSGLRLVDVA